MTSTSPAGTFIVNLGDMLERWSNCMFRSTLHRQVKSFRAKDFGIFALTAVRVAACRVVKCFESFTLRRVLGRGRERYSIPFFMEPNFYTKVECLPHCCSADNPPMYPPTTSGQHILDRYQATHEAYSAGQAGHKEVKA